MNSMIEILSYMLFLTFVYIGVLYLMGKSS
jgi:hypothetical protein